MSDWVTSLPFALATILTLVHVTACVLALGVLPGNRKPSAAMAWLILILAVPYFGILAFLFFGSNTVGRKRRAEQREVNQRVMTAARGLPAAELGDIERPETLRGFDRLSGALGALPLASGNRVEMLSDYRGVFAEMAAEVDRAESFVHVQFYISSWDEWTSDFFDALVRARARGVVVRFMFDHIGSRGIPGYKDFVKKLEATDLTWTPMLPIHPLKGQVRRPDLRNHRKIMVVDGQVAFAGSQNLIEAGYDKPKNHQLGREWVELMMRLEGPVVRQLNVVFATDWFSETGEDLTPTMVEPVVSGPARPDAVEGVGCQVVPSGPGFATENNLRLFNSMIYAARSRLSLTSPYFVPDETLLYAVTTAAQRGVEVELFVSATADQFMVHHAQRSYYLALLEAGVRIWLYPEPFVLHSKHFSVDDWLGVVGSSNMDMRSFALNYEVIVMLTGREVVERLHAVEDTYRSLSTELTLADWKQRGRRAAYVDNVMRLTAALQ